MKKATMWYEWLNVGLDRWTSVSSIGQFSPIADRTMPVDEEHAKLFLIIPGNPGVCNFYEQFAEHLQQRSPKSSVWVISHLNHVQTPIEQPTSDVTLLDQQIKHKLDFILRFIPKNVNLYLIGHSIGCYMILDLLNSVIAANGYNVKQCFLLFPTVERMAETPNGRRFVSSTKYGIHYLLLFFTYIVYFLPGFLKEWLIAIRFNRKNVHRCVFDGVTKLLHSSVCMNAIWMAMDEMKIVKDLNVDIVKRYHDKLTIFYGSTDDWCPLSYCRDMQQTVENSSTKIVVCDPSIEHAFVLTNAVPVANMVADMI